MMSDEIERARQALVLIKECAPPPERTDGQDINGRFMNAVKKIEVALAERSERQRVPEGGFKLLLEHTITNALLDARCWADEKRLPKGWRRIKAYTNGRELVVCGVPDTDDESHNCDLMGCGSVGDHVLHRITLAAAPTPEDTICPRCEDEVDGDASGCRDWDCPMRGGS